VQGDARETDLAWTRDEHYNPVSVLYYALQGADTCDQYALEAEGRQELAGFFRTVQRSHTELADQTKKLLGT
jgi:hypothetical protein